MTTNQEQQILDYLSRPGYKPVKAATLARKLNLSKKDRRRFREALDGLIDGGRVREGQRGRLRLRTAAGLIEGIIKRTASGAGYLIPHERTPELRDGDVFIAARDMGDAHTGDEVLVRLSKRRRTGGQRCGRIEQMLVRATRTFVGTYFERAAQGWVRVDGSVIAEPVFVGDPGAKGARPDDKVVIEMLRFPGHLREGEAVITKVLGARGDAGVDTLSIIHEFGLPQEFPEAALEETSEAADRYDETDLDGRLDLTRETIVTIDPIDARDFDDAISLVRSSDGHWRLGVHIADVAHFVLDGGPLDQEARQRGNSVYLPGTVIPMLPEVLSNGLASLQQGKLRFTKSVFIEYTAEGVPVDTSFANSAINVTRRFAYEEVLPIIQEPERFHDRVPADVRQLLANMHELAMLLRRRRFAAGALELDLPEVKIDFDSEGRVSGAHEAVHDASHQIIEEFMLAANTSVATELFDRGVPYLRRVHGDPDPRRLKALSEFAAALGFRLEQFQSRRDLQDLVDRVKGEPEEHAINYALLRSMKQAEYSGREMGHYALAADNYCHFTSPIRRYPDLVIHRLVDEVLLRDAATVSSVHARPPDPSMRRPGKRARGIGLSDIELEKLGRQCSATERRAEAAERELIKVKLLTFLVERIGMELDAVITGVERFGLFCRGLELPAEGLIHISALDRDDFFDHEESSRSLIGRRTGRRYRLGDRLRVQVAHVDVDRRELDFSIVADQPTSRPPRSTKPRAKLPRKSSRKPRRR